MLQRTVNARNRRTKRFPIHWPTVLVDGDSRQPCTIVEVSRGGAKVRITALVKPGAPITLLDGRVGTLEATVIWRRGDLAGVAFPRPRPRLRDGSVTCPSLSRKRKRVHACNRAGSAAAPRRSVRTYPPKSPRASSLLRRRLAAVALFLAE